MRWACAVLLSAALIGCAQDPPPAGGSADRDVPATPEPAAQEARTDAPPGTDGAAEPDGAPAPADAPPEAPTAPASTPAPETPRAGWVATYDWMVEVEGTPFYEGLFFQEIGSQRLIILVPGMEEAAVLDQNGQKILALARDQVTLTAEGEGAVVAEPAIEKAAESSYTLDQARRSVIFYLGGQRLKILTRQPLVGTVTAEEILVHSPLYRKGIEEYTPVSEDVAAVRAHRGPVRIEVFFGTWCPHCKVVIPKFMKTLAEAANPDLEVAYIGVPRGFANYAEARAKGVRTVPTMIFFRDGREFGRLPGDEGDTIERAVARLLGTQSASR